jgi:hypothetical protein
LPAEYTAELTAIPVLPLHDKLAVVRSTALTVNPARDAKGEDISLAGMKEL